MGKALDQSSTSQGQQKQPMGREWPDKLKENDHAEFNQIFERCGTTGNDRGDRDAGGGFGAG
jgi:hypothetical protein